MRVLQVNFAKAIGGSAYHHADLSKGLLEKGHEVMVIDHLGDFTPRYCGNLPHVQAQRGLRHWQVFQAIQAFKPDILHAHQSLAARLCNRMKGRVPVVATLHGVYKHRSHGGSEGVIRICEHQSQAMSGYSGPSVTIWNWMRRAENPLTRDEARHQLGLKADEFAFGFAGRTVASKGVLDVITAFSAIKAPEARLLILGTGKDLQRAKLLAASDMRVRFLGHVGNASELMKGLDGFVLPSHAESFGLVVIEAMAAGCAIVATQTLGPVEILRDQSATLVPPHDCEALRGAMADVMNEKTPPIHNLAPFRRDTQIDKTIAFYQAVLGGME